MVLTDEDSLRLNVLLANRPLAIRIDEARAVVHALTERGEARVELHPRGRPETYLRAVRELLSGQVLGSPGGYPVYLRRWTRMGQMRDDSLAQLLLLGEPEAVVAAAGAPGLTEDLARRAWWALEDAANARRMLQNPRIAASSLAPTLARYLLDYLPFETDSLAVRDTVRLVLQPGLIDAARRTELWRQSARRPARTLGFLAALPDDLPEPLPARADAAALATALEHAADHPGVQQLRRCVGAAGQTFLHALDGVLARVPDQDLVVAAFDVVRAYFASLRPGGDPDLALAALQAEAAEFVAQPPAPFAACLRQCPALASDFQAMRLLSGVGYGLMRPLLPDPTTAGTLMRRKLAPVLDALR